MRTQKNDLVGRRVLVTAEQKYGTVAYVNGTWVGVKVDGERGVWE